MFFHVLSCGLRLQYTAVCYKHTVPHHTLFTKLCKLWAWYTMACSVAARGRMATPDIESRDHDPTGDEVSRSKMFQGMICLSQCPYQQQGVLWGAWNQTWTWADDPMVWRPRLATSYRGGHRGCWAPMIHAAQCSDWCIQVALMCVYMGVPSRVFRICSCVHLFVCCLRRCCLWRFLVRCMLTYVDICRRISWMLFAEV